MVPVIIEPSLKSESNAFILDSPSTFRWLTVDYQLASYELRVAVYEIRVTARERLEVLATA